MMKISVIGIGMDIAKRVIQLHTVCPETGEIGRFKLQRRETLDFFARREPSVVAMEACGSAHWWGREICHPGAQKPSENSACGIANRICSGTVTRRSAACENSSL